MLWVGGARMHGAKNGAWAWDDKSMRMNFTNWEEGGGDGSNEDDDKDDEGPGGAGMSLVTQLDLMPVIFIWKRGFIFSCPTE